MKLFINNNNNTNNRCILSLNIHLVQTLLYLLYSNCLTTCMQGEFHFTVRETETKDCYMFKTTRLFSIEIGYEPKLSDVNALTLG